MHRTVACTVLALSAALAVPAHAAPTAGSVTFVDAAGDANGINGQSLGLPVPSQSTSPASVGSDDIVKVTLATDYKKKNGRQVPRGFSVTLTLAEAPDTHSDYTVNASVPSGCDDSGGTSLNLQYTEVASVPTTVATCSVSGSTTSTPIGYGTAVVDPEKRTITWSVDGANLKPGSYVESLTAQSTVFVLGVYDVASSDARYRFP